MARVVVITGASSGIGRCTALLFARRGWRVGLIARGAHGLASATQEIVGAGGTARWATADVADPAALEQAAGLLQRKLGAPDIWVNCAGNGVYGPFTCVPEPEFRRVTEVTYLGTVNGTRTALRGMRARGAGTVVNVCSAIAFHGMPLLSSYSGAKHAVRGFTEAVRADLLQDGSAVRVCLVYPPAANTPFFSHAASHMKLPPRPMKPVYQPEVVAAGVWHAALSGQPEVPIGGVTVLFGWAARWLPGLLARAITFHGDAGQMTRHPDAARLRNPTLFQPNPRTAATHGPFGHEARRISTQLWAIRLWTALRRQAARSRPTLPAATPGPVPGGSAPRAGGP